MKIIENKSSFADNEIIQMAKRENNSKRSFLIVNPLQAKHIPANPLLSMKLFEELSLELKKNISHLGSEILFIGFAETATAIGTAVASFFGNSQYIHTTREYIPDAKPVVEFKELHSHAVNQSLQCADWDNLIKDKKHIVFIEDEISTGTTILNFVNALRDNNKVPEDIQFSVCSVINGMTSERKDELLNYGIKFIYLLKISMLDHKDADDLDFSAQKPCEYSEKNIQHIDVNGFKNARTGINMTEYLKSLDNIYNKISEDISGEKIAVIGTEECMFPAIYTAYKIQKNNADCSVFTHSTTRSPVEPHNNSAYPLKSRETLVSFYENSRTTYIYNTYSKYDSVIIITDSQSYSDEAENSLISAFPLCNNFKVIRWVK